VYDSDIANAERCFAVMLIWGTVRTEESVLKWVSKNKPHLIGRLRHSCCSSSGFYFSTFWSDTQFVFDQGPVNGMRVLVTFWSHLKLISLFVKIMIWFTTDHTPTVWKQLKHKLTTKHLHSQSIAMHHTTLLHYLSPVIAAPVHFNATEMPRVCRCTAVPWISS